MLVVSLVDAVVADENPLTDEPKVVVVVVVAVSPAD